MAILLYNSVSVLLIQNDLEKMARGLMDSSNTVILCSLIDAKQLSYKSAQEDQCRFTSPEHCKM